MPYIYLPVIVCNFSCPSNEPCNKRSCQDFPVCSLTDKRMGLGCGYTGVVLTARAEPLGDGREKYALWKHLNFC